MKYRIHWQVNIVAVAIIMICSCNTESDNTINNKDSLNTGQISASGRNENKKTDLENYPERPRLAIQEMIVKYGAPVEVSSESVVWHNAGPYKRIMVTKKEVPHDFPLPHMDFLEHTVSYNVPTDKVDDLVAFDASMTVNKTAGEMSARCDLEGH
ncbi:MAG: hypothetical protein H7X71_04055, partial [Chitinophagales bacterium]|nr:hypothetical protein [Chitinophagales bacterium]